MIRSRRQVLSLLVGGLSWAQVTACCADESPKVRKSNPPQVPAIYERLLFFPSKHPAGNWNPGELTFEDVWFAADDGTRLHGWYCPSENARATILIAHGNAGSIASRASWLRYLQRTLQVTTFMFDYRGYGRSAGVPTVQGVLQDARAARAKLWQLAGVQDAEMLLMGESLGGALVVQLAVESPPRGLILQSTFSSLRGIADVHYPKLSWLVPSTSLDSAGQIAKYRGPLLQSHGDADDAIPFQSGKRLFDTANEPKSFVIIRGAGHNDWMTKEYFAKLNEFIDSVRADVK